LPYQSSLIDAIRSGPARSKHDNLRKTDRHRLHYMGIASFGKIGRPLRCIATALRLTNYNDIEITFAMRRSTNGEQRHNRAIVRQAVKRTRANRGYSRHLA
jgi:hypothetical protein